jgi:tetratricopeptide (TPR) repeat protein
VNLQATLGSLYYKAGREREANQAWERALEGSPADPQRYRIVANVLLENRLLEKAADTYRRGRISCSNPELFTIELAQLLAVTMDYRGASEEELHLEGGGKGCGHRCCPARIARDRGPASV